jgi:hypothetical protein
MAIGKCLRCDKTGKVTEDHVVPQWFLKILPQFQLEKVPTKPETEMVCEACNGTKGGKFDFSFLACRQMMKPIISWMVAEIRKHEEFNP